MKIEAESLYIFQRITSFSKLWYSFKSSSKTCKPCHCHKLILNNINKMSIFQSCIQNLGKHLRWRFSPKQVTAESCQVFLQKDPSQTFDRVLNTPLYSSNYALAYTREAFLKRAPTSIYFHSSPPSSIHLHPAHFSLHPALGNTLNVKEIKISHVIEQFPQIQAQKFKFVSFA